MWRRVARARWYPGEALVRECSAFLSGHLGEELEGTSPVPAWVRLNALAHGSAEQIAALAICDDQFLAPTERTWREALAFLSGEVLSDAHSGAELEEVQRSVLVPIELALAARSERVSLDAAAFVRMVLNALKEHRGRPTPSRDLDSSAG